MIVGITGSFGAGKGAVVNYLKTKGFTHFSASGFITEEVNRRGLELNRDSLIEVANDLRMQHGPSFIIDSLFERAKALGGDVVIESLRAVAEVRRVKELGGIVIGIDAEPRTRYERTQKRKSEKDNVTYDRWLEQERTESNTEDPTKQNIFGALALSDYRIENNGTLEELHRNIDVLLAKINEKLERE